MEQSLLFLVLLLSLNLNDPRKNFKLYDTIIYSLGTQKTFKYPNCFGWVLRSNLLCFPV